MSDQERCSKTVWYGYSSSQCARLAKEDGLCAQHLAGKRRSEKRAAEKEAGQSAKDAKIARMQAKVDRMALHGVQAALVFNHDADWHSPQYVSVSVKVDADALLDVLHRLERAEAFVARNAT